MAFEYGFYNSINGDRKYNALDFGKIFDGVIRDGVFADIGDKLFTTKGSGSFEVLVGTGKAWFNHTWNLNTSAIPFTLSGPHPVLTRYDAVVLEVDENQNAYGRINTIKIVEGAPSSNAVKPTLINTSTIHQHPLAYIKIKPDVSEIKAEDIEIVVGQTICPFVTSILQQTDITALFNNWNGQFDTWFNNLKAQLTDNVVTNLQNQIDQCLKPTDIATAAQLNSGTKGKLVDAAGLKSAAPLAACTVGDVIITQKNWNNIDSRFARCWGGMYATAEYPDWYNAVKSVFNKTYRTIHGPYVSSVCDYGGAFTYVMNPSGSVLHVLHKLNGTNCSITSEQNYNHKRIAKTITYATSANRVVINSIRKSSIRGKNIDKSYVLMKYDTTLTVMEISCTNNLSSLDVTQFNASLTPFQYANYITANNTYLVLDDDTFYLFFISSGTLYYCSFILDRVYNGIRWVKQPVALSVQYPSGTNLSLTVANTPGFIVASGNVYIGVVTVIGNKSTVAFLRVKNKSTTPAVELGNYYSTTSSTTFKHTYYTERNGQIDLVGTGSLVASDSVTQNIIIGYARLEMSNENGSGSGGVADSISLSTFGTQARYDLFFGYVNGSAAIGVTNDRLLIVYKNNYIIVVPAAINNLITQFKTSTNFAYKPLSINTSIDSRAVFSRWRDYGYLIDDYYMLSTPVNNKLIYYPELAAPFITQEDNGLLGYIRIKP